MPEDIQIDKCIGGQEHVFAIRELLSVACDPRQLTLVKAERWRNTSCSLNSDVKSRPSC